MDLLFPDQGLVYQLQQILTAGVKYRLFVNNLTPGLGTTLASLTEAAFAGYAPIAQNWSNFSSLSGVSGHNGFAIAAPINFNNSSGATQAIYGYFVTDPASSPTLLIAVARFDSAPLNVVDGGQVTVVPTWGDFSQLSA